MGAELTGAATASNATGARTGRRSTQPRAGPMSHLVRVRSLRTPPSCGPRSRRALGRNAFRLVGRAAPSQTPRAASARARDSSSRSAPPRANVQYLVIHHVGVLRVAPSAAGARSTARRLLIDHRTLQALKVPSMALLDRPDEWNLVVYLDRVDPASAFVVHGQVGTYRIEPLSERRLGRWRRALARIVVRTSGRVRQRISRPRRRR